MPMRHTFQLGYLERTLCIIQNLRQISQQSEIVLKGSADLDKLVYYTGVTALETVL